VLNKTPIKKTGFLYIYTSNESAQDVFFDNLIVIYNTGPLLEETHYYPYGLTMAGISSKALKGANYAENRLKYNGKELQSGEFADGSGLELYDYKHRMYDQQIIRFIQIDSLANKFEYLTPYQYASNDPIKNIDLDGLEGIISPLIFGAQEPIMRGPILESMIEAGAKAAEVGGKTAETATKSSKFTPETLENFARGNKVEAERLAANGVEKNFKPIETLDPKTGQIGKTIPDTFENGGKSTLEVKSTKSQGLTKQLRLQENYSKGNGFSPRLDINKGAKLSSPLLQSSFKINYYSIIPAPIDNTAVKLINVQR
jgi:RHS repeat-associated protein